MQNIGDPPKPFQSLPGICNACRRPLSQENYGSDFCDRPECVTQRRVRAASDTARHQQEKYAHWLALTERRTAPVLKEAAARIGVSDVKDIAVGIAPYIDLPLTPLPSNRLSAFVAHLRGIVEESFEKTPIEEGPPPPPDEDPDYSQRISEEAPEPVAVNASCIACQGDCCLQGAARMAFLEPKNIDYFRWVHPESEPDDIIETYLSFLPEVSVSGSCVFHGKKGCTLQRDIRANICNSFQCRFRAKLMKAYEDRSENGALVAGISRDHVEDPNAGAPYLRVVSVSNDGQVQVNSDLELPALTGEDKNADD